MHYSKLENPKNCNYIKITPTLQVLYYQHGGSGGGGLPENFVHDKNKYKGQLSDKAKSRLKNAIDWFCELTNEDKEIEIDGKRVIFKQTFITLTLPSTQIHSDTEIKSKLFNHFLTELRQNHNLKNYVWRAERQKNKNIHFHLACDIGIHYKILRDIWNRICNKLGYVDRYKSAIIGKGKAEYIRYLLNNGYELGKAQEYWRLHESGEFVPNSTDIHKVKNVQSMSAYINGYMCKDDSDNQKIEGRIWFISRSLARMNWSFPISENERDMLLNADTKKIEKEQCVVITESPNELKNKGFLFVYELFEYIKEITQEVRIHGSVDKVYKGIELEFNKLFYEPDPNEEKEILKSNKQFELWHHN